MSSCHPPYGMSSQVLPLGNVGQIPSPSLRCAVMTGGAGTGDVKVVNIGVQPAAARVVARLAGVGRRYMGRSLAGSRLCRYGTSSRYSVTVVSMVKGDSCPAATRRMAVVAGVAARNVGRSLPRRRCAVMTGGAATRHVKVVNIGVEPAAARVVARLAGVGGRYMGRSLAGGRCAVMARVAGLRRGGMAKVTVVQLPPAVWQSSQVLPLVMWVDPFPVAVVPL